MAENITELAKRKLNVTIGLTYEELQAITDEAAMKARQAVEEEYRKQQAPETYLTQTQVCKLLNVSVTTLWRWDQKDVLKPIKVGGLNRYKKSDIDRLTA